MGWDLDWDDIVESLGPRLYRYFRVRFTEEAANDLTQETLLRLVRKVKEGKFDPSKGTLVMLGFGIARFVAMEAKKQVRFEPIEVMEDFLATDEDREQVTITRDVAEKIKTLMGLLSDVEQQILSMFVDKELTLREVALLLDLPEGTIKSHIHRAKKKLLRLVQKEKIA